MSDEDLSSEEGEECEQDIIVADRSGEADETLVPGMVRWKSTLCFRRESSSNTKNI